VLRVSASTLLFRQEAIEFQQQDRQLGRVSALQPLSTKLLTWFIAAAVGLIVAFLLVGEYARKETVAGYLTPTSGTAKIFASQPGTIKDIHVREGEQVQDGQPLLTIETNQIYADGYDVNTTILSTLRSQSDLLKGQIAAEEQRTRSEHDRLFSLIHGLKTEISQLEAQIKTQVERLQVAQEFVSSSRVSGPRDTWPMSSSSGANWECSNRSRISMP
jgi:membrane fusion protein